MYGLGKRVATREGKFPEMQQDLGVMTLGLEGVLDGLLLMKLRRSQHYET